MTLYLSRLRLDPRNTQVRSELRSPYEMHRTLAKAFAPSSGSDAEARAALGDARVLFRADEGFEPGAIVVLVQSRTAPAWGRLTAGTGYLLSMPEMKSFMPLFRLGQRLTFRLRANPTVRRSGKRYGLYHDGEQISWLRRKAEHGGFIIERVDATVDQRVLRAPRKGSEMEFLAVRFDGVLRVADPACFGSTLTAGIGSAKAFGFGLLSVAVARE